MIKIHAGTSLHNFTAIKYRLLHTLLMHNISVLSMSVDQVVLDNPLAGLTGDADIEAGMIKKIVLLLYFYKVFSCTSCPGVNLPKPSLLFDDEAIENPTRTDVHDISDGVSSEFVLFAARYRPIRLIQSMIVATDSMYVQQFWYSRFLKKKRRSNFESPSVNRFDVSLVFRR